MQDPFALLAPEIRPTLFWIAGGTAAAAVSVLVWIGPPQVAYAVERAQNSDGLREAIKAWGPRGPLLAYINLEVDTLLLVPAYVLLIGLACSSAARAHPGGWTWRTGLLLAWSALAAGFADWIENALVQSLITSGFVPEWMKAARIATVVKFTFLALCLLYLAGVWLADSFR